MVADYRKCRDLIGLVPQEITLEPFENVLNTVKFSRGLFGKPANSDYIETVSKFRAIDITITKRTVDQDTTGAYVSNTSTCWSPRQQIRAFNFLILPSGYRFRRKAQVEPIIAMFFSIGS